MPGLLLQADHDRVGRIIHNEYFEQDVVKFRELARARVPAQSLWQATGGQLDQSTRYRNILADLGNGDDVRVVFRSGSTVWGSACLARTAADQPFSRDDILFLARVGEPVARGLRLSHLLAGNHPAGPAAPGVLILGDDDSIISSTDAAQHWLAQLPRTTPAAWICRRRFSARPAGHARWRPDGQAPVSPKDASARRPGTGCACTPPG